MTDEPLIDRLQTNRQNSQQLLDFVHLVTAEPEDQELALLTALTVHMERRYGAEAAGPVLSAMLAQTMTSWAEVASAAAPTALGSIVKALHHVALAGSTDRAAAASGLIGAAASILEPDFGKDRAVELIKGALLQALALAEPQGNA